MYCHQWYSQKITGREDGFANTDDATITVNINNINDNNPLIPDATVSIDEDAANTTAVHDVDDSNTGNDTDSDGQALTYSITAGNGDGIFTVDAGTGAITVLDRHTVTSSKLPINRIISSI